MCHWNWELILEYVTALVWPVLIGAIVLLFRSQIAARIQALREVEGLGVKAKMDGEVKQLGEKVDAAADRLDAQQPPEPEPPSDDPGQRATPKPPRPPKSPLGSGPAAGEPTQEELEEVATVERRRLEARSAQLREERALALLAAAEQLIEPADFGTALEVATTSPNAAVMLAYTELEKVARAAWTVTTMEPDSPRQTFKTIMRELTSTLGSEFPGLVRDLSDVRNRVAHGAGEVSLDGALTFIASCERLADVIGSSAASKVRHPSRSQALRAAWDLLRLHEDRSAQPDT